VLEVRSRKLTGLTGLLRGCTLYVYRTYVLFVHRGIGMSVRALTRPERKTVNRSELRQKQSATLRMARGNQVVVISANHEEDEKLLLDKKYFDEIVKQLQAVIETLEIIGDQKLFNQILGVSESLEENTRLGRLHSFEEAFGEK
jgi:hypothetical protein